MVGAPPKRPHETPSLLPRAYNADGRGGDGRRGTMIAQRGDTRSICAFSGVEASFVASTGDDGAGG